MLTILVVCMFLLNDIEGFIMNKTFYCLKKNIISLLLILPSTGWAISFQDVTSESGISYIGQSWGGAWGDFNGDGWPDLWTSNHGNPPSLYINNQDGSFTDIASAVLLPDGIWDLLPGYDAHGAAWADFDNDGDQDLVQLADGGIREQANQLYVNTGNGVFERVEQAVYMGIDQPLANARTPMWFDWNNDGLLDLLAINAMRSTGVNPPATLFEQQSNGFVSVQSTELNLQEPTSFSMISDLTGDGRKEILIGASTSAMRVYSNTSLVLTDETVNLGLDQFKRAQDIILSDLTGDSQTELYVVRGEVVNAIERVGDNIIESSLTASKNQKGFSFNTTGQLSVDLYPLFKVKPTDIFIGSTGFNPDSINFSLSPDDPNVAGLPVYTPGVDNGFYMGFDTATSQWTVNFSSSKFGNSRNLVVTSDSVISNLQAINFDNDAVPRPDLLLVNQGGAFNEEAVFHGIDIPSSGRSIVVADFDNDMDQDIYILASGPVVNLPNLLYENDGMGNFTSVANAGGGGGSLLGRGDTVSVVDFDQDGFLDIFLTNGKSKPPFESDGPYQLFKNTGNDNHWIELDLEGLMSNRDGIGATVKLTAGGITQVREQSGGMHRRTQNFQRIHFGLGANQLIDEIQLEWPSGVIQSINNVNANQIMRIIEPGALSVRGRPDYQVGADNQAYIWKQYYDGPYHVRVNGNGSQSSYLLQLLSSEVLSNVVGQKLYQGNDLLSVNDSSMSLNGMVSSGEDGVDISVTPDAKVILSFQRDSYINPRQLSVGSSALPLMPAGWIKALDDIPVIPAFSPLTHVGMYIGADVSNNLSVRFNTNGLPHSYSFDLFSSTAISSIRPFEMEQSDMLQTGVSHLSIDGRVGVAMDGVDLTLSAGSVLGWMYQYDKMNRADKVNKGNQVLGYPNAYQLPRSEPYTQPVYNAANDTGVFLWKDDLTGLWHLQATAGGGHMKYSGEIVSAKGFLSVQGNSLESSDILDTSIPTSISFNFNMINQWQDGLIFELPDDVNFSVNITEAQQINGAEISNIDPAPLFFIGGENWPVQAFPVDIGLWE